MMDQQPSIQTVYNSQEEVEKLILGLSITNGKVYASIREHQDVRNMPEYKLAAEAYYGILQNIGHLLRDKDSLRELPADPQKRTDKVAKLIEAARLSNIGKIGRQKATFIPVT